ncbi:DHA2 family efflux MFS transporter permease subunit [Streptomyces sp. NBC_01750]|uniref:DHA2 family efflux MFS transporter permease subunit n=1 Tax=Streptomyces sp. NBC_01750 TaxID=2975928 RepID=UPI002DDBE858|nr:DHA2 family efflux MFS transporter permease subunit [Streptomyces sp. NBC_01750]WSD35889.1 DHA2 family efflux MFS transporter permease subunit [Streptomyces sp. NBC_01750]
MVTSPTAVHLGAPPQLGGRRWVALVVICMAALLLSVDLTVLQLAIPSLIKDLHPTSSQTLWIADVYGLTLSGLLVTMGSFGDRIGRKKLLLAGSFSFAAASVLCAYADSPGWLIFGRALLGVAGATVYPTTLSIIRNIFTDPKERTTAVGIWAAMISGGMAIGPVIGGPLLNNFWWGSVFLINVPIMVLLFSVAVVVVPESRSPLPGRIDPVSVVLSIVGIVGIVYAIQESVHDGFTDKRVLAAAVIGVVALLVFGLKQVRMEHPLIDVKLFRNMAFSGAVAANTFALFAFIGTTLLLSQYFQLVHQWSPLKSGLAMLPPAGAAILIAPVIGMLVPKIGRAKLSCFGLAVGAGAMVFYSTLEVETSYGIVIIPIILQGIGAVSTFTVTSDTIVNSAPKERSGAAAALATTAAELGGALGMAVLGTILNNRYQHTLTLPEGTPASIAAAANDSLGGALEATAAAPGQLASAIVDAADDAFMRGLHSAVLLNVVILGAVAIAALITLRHAPASYPEDFEEEFPGLGEYLAHHPEEAAALNVSGAVKGADGTTAVPAPTAHRTDVRTDADTQRGS